MSFKRFKNLIVIVKVVKFLLGVMIILIKNIRDLEMPLIVINYLFKITMSLLS